MRILALHPSNSRSVPIQVLLELCISRFVVASASKKNQHFSITPYSCRITCRMPDIHRLSNGCPGNTVSATVFSRFMFTDQLPSGSKYLSHRQVWSTITDINYVG